MPLHLTYRPKAFSEVIGNETVVNSLSTVLSREKDRPHAFLFDGPSGCGKTTLARITAGLLGIESNDLVELDAAQYRGIDTVREIQNVAGLSPMFGSHRGWILDEVHQFSKDAQNGLLKLLEDTPKNCSFLLCTTEPEKLIRTIRTRCHAFSVNALRDVEMRKLLTVITVNESVELDEVVISKIIQEAAGSPRMALVMLDQVIDLPLEKQVDAVQQIAAEENDAIKLCHVLVKGRPWKEVADVLSDLQKQDVERLRRLVLSYCRTAMLRSANLRAFQVSGEFLSPFYNSGFEGLVTACFKLSYKS
jgi:DNA polymerase III gamma/tau subunit